MICDFCHKNDAVIFLEQMNPAGEKKKLCLCSECALRRGLTPDSKKINSIIPSLFAELKELGKKFEKVEKKQSEVERLCPVCGNSSENLKKFGLTGCPECYAIFKNEIRTYFEKHEVYGNYTGSLPKRLGSVHSVLNDRMILQQKLEEAIASEDYEKAAMFRDYLRAIESSPVAPGEKEDE